MITSIKITNRGNTIRATGAAANALFKALTEQKAPEIRHRHVNNGSDDACKDCGKDLRDEVHFRVGEQ